MQLPHVVRHKCFSCPIGETLIPFDFFILWSTQKKPFHSSHTLTFHGIRMKKIENFSLKRFYLALYCLFTSFLLLLCRSIRVSGHFDHFYYLSYFKTDKTIIFICHMIECSLFSSFLIKFNKSFNESNAYAF